MSNLVTSVAATLTDHVFADLKKENDKIRKKCHQLSSVEITGPKGHPVYASAQFGDDGYYQGASKEKWQVSFSFDDQHQQERRQKPQLLPCPLSDLRDVEIHVGGVRMAYFSESNRVFYGILNKEDNHHIDGKVVVFLFAGSPNLHLGCVINDWPEEHWQTAIRGEGPPEEGLVDYLVDVVHRETSGTTTIRFYTVAFSSDSVRGAIENLKGEIPNDFSMIRPGDTITSELIANKSLPDLAPFVAAVLPKDPRVFVDLKKENDDLKKLMNRMNYSGCVEITGPDGEPVYARAQFDEDGNYSDNPNLWGVNFSTDDFRTCHLSELPKIEIRVGGIRKANFDFDMDFEGFLDDSDDDYEDGKVVSFYFGGGLWMMCMVRGWPEERWRAAVAGEAPQGDGLLRHLADVVATETPQNKIVDFLGVSFTVDSVCGAIKKLKRPTSEELERRRNTLNALIEIMTQLRAEGNNEEGSELLRLAMEIYQAQNQE